MQLQDITIIVIIMALKRLVAIYISRSCNRDYVVRTEQNRLFGDGFEFHTYLIAMHKVQEITYTELPS